ncbi:hypothetical protein ACLB2K_024962 [Fragaria x ananassa]
MAQARQQLPGGLASSSVAASLSFSGEGKKRKSVWTPTILLWAPSPEAAFGSPERKERKKEGRKEEGKRERKGGLGAPSLKKNREGKRNRRGKKDQKGEERQKKKGGKEKRSRKKEDEREGKRMVGWLVGCWYCCCGVVEGPTGDVVALWLQRRWRRREKRLKRLRREGGRVLNGISS